MQVHLVDGTYELFRHFFAVPSRTAPDGTEIGAVRGVVDNLLRLLEDGATHVGVATDHVIESYRNELYAGYKTGEGVDPVLKAQFPILEDALRALGLTVWAMVEYEADDALAAAARVAADDERVERVLICTPDKDLAQAVVGTRIVQLDRRKRQIVDEDGVIAKFGVPPASIPDYLGLVGDSADGFPGIPGWGAKSTAAVLSHYGHLEQIPAAPGQWEVTVRGAAKLAAALTDQLADALLFRELATLQTEGPDVGSLDDWAWSGPTDDLAEWEDYLDAGGLVERAEGLRAKETGR
ncbi:MAG: 5'-3' exonuclease H3TH domain-containing protein [Actinomycetota bacterium]|nr:5'-3' exonuclease H3TH domain-containing protein [Actinomycetota bacterium]